MAVPREVDVAIVGAGTAGAAAARYFAERGARVVAVERRALDQAGARWVNGITRTALAEAGLTLPAAAIVGGPHPFWLASRHGRVLVDRHDVVDVDMRALVAFLQAQAEDAGAALVGGVAVRGRDGRELITDAGRIRARWIVDASGLVGARLLAQPAVAHVHLCAAAQEVRAVRDRAGALAYCEALGIAPGEVLARVGLAGGFSVLNVRVSDDGERISILTGSIPALGFPSGKAILDQFVRDHPWVGDRIFGGAGAIPLRRPYDRLSGDGVALIGDAGCQVFPAHGSGIGAGILAAKLLADTLAAGGALRDYEVAWHRRWGGLFAAYDAVRRWNSELDDETLGAIMELGLIDGDIARAGLDQVLPPFTLASLPPKARALRHAPQLLPGLAKVAARIGAAQLMSALYPRNVRALGAWSRGMARLLGDRI